MHLALHTWLYTLAFVHLALCTWVCAPGSMCTWPCVPWLYALGSMHLGLRTWLYAPGSMHLALCTWLYALGSTHLALYTWLYALGSVRLALCAPGPACPGSMRLALRTWLYALGSMHLALCTWLYPLGSVDLALRDLCNLALCNSLCATTLRNVVQGLRAEEPFTMLLGESRNLFPFALSGFADSQHPSHTAVGIHK